MLNLHLKSIRKVNNAYLYFHLLDSYLNGIDEQRNRIKKIAIDHGKSMGRVFNSESTLNDQVHFLEMKKSLFREIRVFFWWWRPVFVILWEGEYIRKENKQTECLEKLLDKSFSEQIKKYRNLVKDFCDVRDDLEHILERIYNGNHDLGNLSTEPRRREFQICGKSIDISDNSLDFVDTLSSTINKWLQDFNQD